jgi:hypothetical protein
MSRFLAPFIAAAFMLGACATAPSYTPATTPNGAGYFERQIEGNRYFVTYRAAGEADALMLQDFALLRAAELTLQQGGDWFWVDRRTLDDAAAPSGPRLGVSVGGGSFGSHSGVGVGVGMSFPLGRGGQRAHSATVEMRIGEGPKPDDANAFDAHAIAANLRARLAPPP